MRSIGSGETSIGTRPNDGAGWSSARLPQQDTFFIAVAISTFQNSSVGCQSDTAQRAANTTLLE
jgi:hypothetical protein